MIYDYFKDHENMYSDCLKKIEDWVFNRENVVKCSGFEFSIVKNDTFYLVS